MSKELLNAVKEKFANAGFKIEESIRNAEGLSTDLQVVSYRHINVKVIYPKGDANRTIMIDESADLEKILASSIEKFQYLSDFEAIWSKELGVVECELEFQNDNHFLSYFEMFDDFLDIKRYISERRDHNKRFEFKQSAKEWSVTIGDCSEQYHLLYYHQRRSFPRTILTLRIEGLYANTESEIREKLLKIGRSALFQYDLKKDIPLQLSENWRGRIARELYRKEPNWDAELNEPVYEYDQDAFDLYMYARTSGEMPLLQYLAFYQVLEYYFPMYSLNEAQKKIRNLIKDPLFNVESDQEVSRLINLIKLTGKGKSLGDEKSQIKATIQGIIDQESLLEYYKGMPERLDFFGQNKNGKRVAKQKINFSAPDNDIRTETAQRIYEIRCKVVHAKDDESFESLLPTSPEVREIGHDLALVEFLARKAIIAASRPLSI